MTAPQRRLREFTGTGYDKGRPKLVQALWFACMNLLFMQWWFPARWRPRLLRLFGATIGSRVFIRHRVRILWPWKLVVQDDVWLGEDVWLLNLEPIVIEHDACLSQGVFLIAGSHDRRAVDFAYDNRPIRVEAGAWIAARAVILRGVTVGRGATVGAGAVVAKDVPPGETVMP